MDGHSSACPKAQLASLWAHQRPSHLWPLALAFCSQKPEGKVIPLWKSEPIHPAPWLVKPASHSTMGWSRLQKGEETFSHLLIAQQEMGA